MKPNLSIDFLGIKFKNPVFTASGTFGYGYEIADLIPLKKLGAIITKTITIEAKEGNPSPRIAETECGMLNSIGLQNIGIRAFVKEPLEKLKKIGVPIIVSIAGACVEDYVQTIEILNQYNGISAIELNLSCPNLQKQIICHDINLTHQIINSVKKISKFPIIAKLSPLITDIASLALTAQNAGADAVTIANTYPAMAIDIMTFKPKLAVIKGGLSGACIKPITIARIYEAYKKIKIPILGCGGIMNAADAIEFILAGATCISIGSAALLSPGNLIKIIDGIKDILIDKKIKDICSIIGKTARDF
jgi:dihydroorotate dehydrogenase (NAD+) catalytic subunit